MASVFLRSAKPDFLWEKVLIRDSESIQNVPGAGLINAPVTPNRDSSQLRSWSER